MPEHFLKMTKSYAVIGRSKRIKVNKAFIDIRLRPGIATPPVAIRPITAKRDVVHKTGST